MSLLRLEIHERDPRRLTVALGGELDLADVPGARAATERALATGRALAIDLSELEFVDLAGAVLLLELASRDHGTEVVVLASDHPAVNGTLGFVGLDPVRSANYSRQSPN